MKRLNLFLLIPIFIVSVPELDSQELVKNSVITGVCYAGDKVNRIYIPPPDEFFRKCREWKEAQQLKYIIPAFPIRLLTAVEYAASILKTMLPADVKITVLATWTKITSTGVLANSSTTGYAAGWGIDALQPYALYPAALAEKIAGKSLNFDLEGDIELTVNSSVNWYLGTDGKTSAFSYDLVTVVLHELIHGLGFFDSMSVG